MNHRPPTLFLVLVTVATTDSQIKQEVLIVILDFHFFGPPTKWQSVYVEQTITTININNWT